jgi:hypothetical protein
MSQVVVLLVVIAGANRMIGQEKPASLPRPLYPLPRYEEDWTLLSDPAKRDDFWDPIKFIPLNEDRNVFLSLGGEWREGSNDGLYGIPGNLIVPSNGVKSRYEGSRPIAQLDWQMTRHLSTHVNYIYVFNGSFEEQSIHATTSMSYISSWVTYRF